MFTFNDKFVDNRNIWVECNDQDALLKIENGYIIEHKRNFGYYLAWKSFDDNNQEQYSIRTTIQEINASNNSSYGLVWGLKDINNFLCCLISSSGDYYRFSKIENSTWYHLRDWTRNPMAFSPYEKNEIKIIKNKNKMEFYLKGLLIEWFYWNEVPFGNGIGFIVGPSIKIKVSNISLNFDLIYNTSDVLNNQEITVNTPELDNQKKLDSKNNEAEFPVTYELSDGTRTTDYEEWITDWREGGYMEDPDYFITHSDDDDIDDPDYEDYDLLDGPEPDDEIYPVAPTKEYVQQEPLLQETPESSAETTEFLVFGTKGEPIDLNTFPINQLFDIRTVSGEHKAELKWNKDNPIIILRAHGYAGNNFLFIPVEQQELEEIHQHEAKEKLRKEESLLREAEAQQHPESVEKKKLENIHIRQQQKEKARKETEERIAKKAAEKALRQEERQRQLPISEAAENVRRMDIMDNDLLETARMIVKVNTMRYANFKPKIPSALRISDNCINIIIANGVSMEFLRIPSYSKSLMGSDKEKDPQAFDNELPQHKIDLSEYWIGKYPVTVAQFNIFMKTSGYHCNAETNLQNGDHPVTQVTWDDTKAFCTWLNGSVLRESLFGMAFRLPDEAEWEKAARGTDGRIYPWGNQAPSDKLCNFNSNVKNSTPIGHYSPQGDSPYGCVDMAGNVWEWTLDWYNSTFYKYSIAFPHPKGPLSGKYHVLRGGDWSCTEQFVRSAVRREPASDCDPYTGFRCAALVPAF